MHRHRGLPKNEKGSKASLTTPRRPPKKLVEDGTEPRYSGLWECYADSTDREKEDVAMEMDREGGEAVHGRRLRNIQGFLLKRRKAPLKGWHKRFFQLEDGCLTYGRNPSQFAKGKALCRVDLGTAVITFQSENYRIDVDGEGQVLHLKAKTSNHFSAWALRLQEQQYSQQKILAGMDAPAIPLVSSMPTSNIFPGREDSDGMTTATNNEHWYDSAKSIIESVRKELYQVRDHVDFPRSPAHMRSSSDVGCISHHPLDVSLFPVANGNVVTDSTPRKKRGLGRRKNDKKTKDSLTVSREGKETGTVDTLQLPRPVSPVSVSCSQLDDPVFVEESASVSGSDTTSVSSYHLMYPLLGRVFEQLDRLESVLNAANQSENAERKSMNQALAGHKAVLRQSLLQNTELKQSLAQIQSISSGILRVESNPTFSSATATTPSRRFSTAVMSVSAVAKTPNITPAMGNITERSHHPSALHQRGSQMSLQSIVSENLFFDAMEQLSDASSESDEEIFNSAEDDEEASHDEEDDVYSSFVSASISSHRLSSPLCGNQALVPQSDVVTESIHAHSPLDKGHRTTLPAPAVDTSDISLWSLLRKNIGKDLSKVSMPVSLNEPLSALQRLCEELHYSELLDTADSLSDPYDRMVQVAAFAVSTYSPYFHRPKRKPFNPILGETYECIHAEKNFKFISEQVSHHPPIAACHCSSPHFTFWQDARIKSKFWGKSMEVFPIGTVHVKLPNHDDHYRWKKVTSCIYNVLGGQRWVDHYGEMTITNGDKCSCKLTFVKASYWSSKKYQVHGGVYSPSGEKVRHLFGAWHEAMFCGSPSDNPTCVWTAAPMPPDSEKYYGFSQFAIELNELKEYDGSRLPRTDSRHRPDQRLLENGCLNEAEAEKLRVEQIQRRARAERERVGQEWTPTFFELSVDEDGRECWIFKNNYWQHREQGSTFFDEHCPHLW